VCLVSRNLNFLNRPVRTRMPGGVAGARPYDRPPMPIDVPLPRRNSPSFRAIPKPLKIVEAK
jgi:hypothetical protein